MNQIRIAMRAIAFEYNVGECYSHTGDSNRATSFWCSSHSNRGRWIRCTTWRCRFDSLPMRIVCSECNANTAMSFWCECKLNSAMNIAIHIAVAEWDVHVNWIRWIATYRDSTVFTVFTIFSFDANLIHCLVTWVQLHKCLPWAAVCGASTSIATSSPESSRKRLATLTAYRAVRKLAPQQRASPVLV